MKFTTAQIGGYPGEFLRRARRADSEKSRGLGIAKFVDAVVEEGGESTVQRKITTVDLSKVFHDFSQVLPFLTDKARKACHQ